MQVGHVSWLLFLLVVLGRLGNLVGERKLAAITVDQSTDLQILIFTFEVVRLGNFVDLVLNHIGGELVHDCINFCAAGLLDGAVVGRQKF